ncbi:MAG: ABC transporter permease [Candidatus Cohnella colombiensis]|uniref:ABC transporter permease n=1 Tax=Candidatus Cohnella colombiensis TaxID=3121368 RepID=A0AA95EUJ4_9BACL|nr:MAG: ABC transporter permease [Cohnella sp.]
MALIAKDKFEPLEKVANAEVILRPSQTYWQDAWRRLKLNKMAMAGLFILIILSLFAILAPFISGFDYKTQYLKDGYLSPSATHFFGTDQFGRDVWVRVWWGVRISLFIGLAAALIDLVFGVLYGGISAYFGGRVDSVMQRIIEIIYSIPLLLLAILFIVFMGPGITSIIIAYAISGWVGMARLVRGQILLLKEQEYVLAARTLGAKPARIILQHLLPNVLGLVIIQITFAVPSAIFFESFLSFIGVGIRPPMASLGKLISEGASVMRYHLHLLLFPTIVFSLIMISFNVLGDGLRDALDPKMRK